MKKLRNFKCSSTGEVFERRVEDDTLTTECKCGGEASRLLSAPRYFGNSTGRSPSASKR